MTTTTPARPVSVQTESEEAQMMVRISSIAYVYADNNGKMRDFLKENVGQWMTVDTDCLFNNQYNTSQLITSGGELHCGWRLYDSMIDMVINDARAGKGKCKYCGEMVSTGQGCSKHPECLIYGIEWFTEKNTFFLKYPNGYNVAIKELEPVKIGSYELRYYESLGYFRLRNCRKRFDFKYIDGEYWIHNGIGYTRRKFLDIPSNLTEKIKVELSKFFKQ
jgi:hypothetical protein